jgi:hypothetical protein
MILYRLFRSQARKKQEQMPTTRLRRPWTPRVQAQRRRNHEQDYQPREPKTVVCMPWVRCSPNFVCRATDSYNLEDALSVYLRGRADNPQLEREKLALRSRELELQALELELRREEAQLNKLERQAQIQMQTKTSEAHLALLEKLMNKNPSN